MTAASPGRAGSSAGVGSDFVVQKAGGAPVRLGVAPGAKSPGLPGIYGEEALKVAAPPLGGKANAETGRFLASLAGVASWETRVVRGLSAGNKTVFVGGVSVAGAREAISSHLP